MIHDRIRRCSATILIVSMALMGMVIEKSGVNASQETSNLPQEDKLINNAIDESSGLALHKIATPNEDGTWDINLEAYTTGKVVSDKKTIPTDIVLVLDQSGSMGWHMDPDDSNTEIRKKVLSDAADSFIKGVEKNAKDNGVEHRIAVVGFASAKESSDKYPAYLNTELFIGSTQYNYNKNEIKRQYKNAFQNVTKDTQLRNLHNSIKSLDASGATATDLGLEMAYKILEADTKEGERNRVVILFTDGEPTHWIDTSADVKNTSISQAKKIKSYNSTSSSEGVQLYSIGVLEGADPTDTQTDINAFMNYVSSNYPHAESLENPGVGSNQNYYMAAETADDLKDIFESILDNIVVPNIDLDASTILKDVISPYFQPIAGSVKLYTQEYTGLQDGQRQWGNPVSLDQGMVSLEDKTLSVQGFDYNANCIQEATVDTGPKGKKLGITITVERSPWFYGGNSVPTNEDTSGIYRKNQEAVDYFDIPSVDVPILYDIQSQDTSIYISQNANGKSLTNFQNNAIRSDWPDGKNNAYVNIKYELIEEESGDVVKEVTLDHGTALVENPFELELKGITKDTKYNVNATVTPANTPQISPGVENVVICKPGMVHVFYPEIAWKDAHIFYGESIDLDACQDMVTWFCHSTDQYPDSEAPKLTYQYYLIEEEQDEKNPHTLFLNHSINVNITSVSAGEMELLPDNAKINGDTTCNDQEEHAEDRDFTVHLLKGKIELTKMIEEQYTNQALNNANQSFVYRIERFDEPQEQQQLQEPTEIYYEVLNFSANQAIWQKSAYLMNLRKGYYRITEEEAWSVLYRQKEAVDTDVYGTLSNSDQDQLLYIGNKIEGLDTPNHYFGESKADTKAKGYAHITFKNIKNNYNWLSDAAVGMNQFKASS